MINRRENNFSTWALKATIVQLYWRCFSGCKNVKFLLKIPNFLFQYALPWSLDRTGQDRTVNTRAVPVARSANFRNKRYCVLYNQGSGSVWNQQLIQDLRTGYRSESESWEEQEVRKSPQKHSIEADGVLGLNHLVQRRPTHCPPSLFLYAWLLKQWDLLVLHPSTSTASTLFLDASRTRVMD